VRFCSRSSSSCTRWRLSLAQRQATAHESGEDELTAIKEPKLECGAKAKGPSLRAGIRQQAVVIGIANAAQALATARSTQVMIGMEPHDAHIQPYDDYFFFRPRYRSAA
jgi:hypothetical protein